MSLSIGDASNICDGEIGARGGVMIAAIVFDLVVMVVFAGMKLRSDPSIVLIAILMIVAVFIFERWFLSSWRNLSMREHDHSGH